MATIQLNSKATALETHVDNKDSDYVRAVFEQVLTFVEAATVDQNNKIIGLEAKVRELEIEIFKLKG